MKRFFIFFQVTNSNDETICTPTVFHNGRWYYDCNGFTGGMSQNNPVSIVRHVHAQQQIWAVQTETTAQDFINTYVPGKTFPILLHIPKL